MSDLDSLFALLVFDFAERLGNRICCVAARKMISGISSIGSVQSRPGQADLPIQIHGEYAPTIPVTRKARVANSYAGLSRAIPATVAEYCSGAYSGLRGAMTQNLPQDFDPQVYLSLHPDVAAAGVAPADHYLRHGIAEGRPYKKGPTGGGNSRPPTQTFDRIRGIFGDYDFAGKRGLEFGALSRPLLRGISGVTMRYADHLSTDEIKKKYLGNDRIRQEDIIDVSYVLDGRPLPDLIPEVFDFALGVHVGEHVPDILGWWHELAGILRPDGCIALALPDKRRCFDLERRLSSTADVVGAWLEQRKKPSAAAAFEQGAYAHFFKGAPVWMQLKPSSELERTGTLARGLSRARLSLAEYVDTHCWVFTPRSFTKILCDLAEIQVLPFKVRHFEIPPQSHAEFYVCLQRCSDLAEIQLSCQQAARKANYDPLPDTPILG